MINESFPIIGARNIPEKHLFDGNILKILKLKYQLNTYTILRYLQ